MARIGEVSLEEIVSENDGSQEFPTPRPPAPVVRNQNQTLQVDILELQPGVVVHTDSVHRHVNPYDEKALTLVFAASRRGGTSGCTSKAAGWCPPLQRGRHRVGGRAGWTFWPAVADG